MGKFKNDTRGSVGLVILVGMLALTSLIMISILSTNEKYNNIQMTERITSRYLGETSVEIQKYLLHNKLDNKIIKLYFYEDTDQNNEKNRVYFKGDTLFTPQEVYTGGITDINYVVSRLIDETAKYGVLKDITTNIKLEDPNKAEDTELTFLCGKGVFFNEKIGDNFDNMKCKLDDLYFSSDIEYIGGKLKVILKISGLEVIRESYFSVDETTMIDTLINGENKKFGEVQARIITEDMKIETVSFQNYRKGINNE